MTVRELISLNQMITDLEITVRRKDGKLLDQLNIGPSEGVKPPYPTRVPKDERYIDNVGYYSETHRDAAYIGKSINAWDDGREYWQVKPERLPKQWLELEVTSWDSFPASTVGTSSPRRGGIHKNINFHGERLRIETLPSGQSLEIVQKKEEPEVEEEDQQLPLVF